jgi:hypothetical protein
MMEGRSELSLRTAREIDQMNEHQNLAEGKRFSPLLVLTLARFGRWDEVLNTPLPPTDQLFEKAMFHYARGMSYAAKLDFAAAQTELSALEAIAGDPQTKPLDQPQLPGAKLIVLGKHILAGELAGRRSQNTEMNQYFATAIQLEDAMPLHGATILASSGEADLRRSTAGSRPPDRGGKDLSGRSKAPSGKRLVVVWITLQSARAG